MQDEREDVRTDDEDGPVRNASLPKMLQETFDMPELLPTVVGDPKRQKLAFHEGLKDAKGRRKRAQERYYVGRGNAG